MDIMDEETSNVDEIVMYGQASARKTMSGDNQFRSSNCTVPGEDVISQNEEQGGHFNNENVVFDVGFTHFQGSIHKSQDWNGMVRGGL